MDSDTFKSYQPVTHRKVCHLLPAAEPYRSLRGEERMITSISWLSSTEYLLLHLRYSAVDATTWTEIFIYPKRISQKTVHQHEACKERNNSFSFTDVLFHLFSQYRGTHTWQTWLQCSHLGSTLIIAWNSLLFSSSHQHAYSYAATNAHQTLGKRAV